MKKDILLLWLLVCVLTACQTANGQGIEVTGTSESTLTFADTALEIGSRGATCIPPVAKLAFPVAAPSISNPENIPSLHIEPGPEFELISESSYSPHIATSIFFQPAHILWIESGTGIYSYNLNTGEWKRFEKLADREADFSRLFRMSDGTVWGYNHFSFIEDDAHVPILSKYDPIKQQFISVFDIEQLLTRENFETRDRPVEDRIGQIWMILARDTDSYLFTFNTNTLHAQSHARLSDTSTSFAGLTFGPDGNLWMVDASEGRLWYFNPDTQELTEYQGIPDQPVGMGAWERQIGGMLYADRHQRLWIGDFGWLDFSHPERITWFKVIRSPVFIDEVPTSRQYYFWHPAQTMYHSTRDEYWFSSSAGIVRLEPESADWCLVTTGAGAFTEDAEGNIWIVAYDKVYRYALDN